MTIEQALLPFARRADAPGAERCGDDERVTVFMKDCRKAKDELDRFHADYRILTRLIMPAPIARPADCWQALLMDTETTGLDPERHQVIELAALPVYYTADKLLGIGHMFHAYNQPREPIPLEITSITGITDDMVKGHTLASPELDGLISSSLVIICHHAAFDRPFLEAALPARFEAKPFACSLEGVPWHGAGYRSRALESILAHRRIFYDAHNATSDVEALFTALTFPIADTNAFTFARLHARKITFRVKALKAPFHAKDILKARGYRWHPGDLEADKYWHKEIANEDAQAEEDWLRANVYTRLAIGDPLPATFDSVDAFTRFSKRG